MFNFSDSTGLEISRNFWIYWVITIQLTIMAFGGLQALIKYRERKEESEDQNVKTKEKQKKKKIDEEMGITNGNH
jgi:TRAP-type C4-dicarboxylate transport system permease small subunit